MDSASKLIQVFVTSRLDNLNSLLVELPDYVLNKLQLVQNNAARLVAREKKSSHVTPLLKQLHLTGFQSSIVLNTKLFSSFTNASWNGTSLSVITAHRLPPRNIYVFEIWQGKIIR